MSDIEVTGRTKHRRLPERGSHDRGVLYGILDEGMVCHVGFSGPDGPFVIPMGYARDGDRLLLHGSVGSRLMRRLGDGADVCVTVTLLDGLVLARSGFHHSMNYRSAVVLGKTRPISGREARRQALDALTEHLVPGRTRDARGPSEKELSITAVVELPLAEASTKVRTGPPSDDPEDMSLPVWAGVIPLRLVPGTPEPAADLVAGVDIPPYVVDYRRGSRD